MLLYIYTTTFLLQILEGNIVLYSTALDTIYFSDYTLKTA